MVIRHYEGGITVPNDNLSKLNWLKKLNEPVKIDWYNNLKKSMVYRSDLIYRSDDILLTQKRFEEDQRLQREAIMEEYHREKMTKKIEKEAEELRRHNEKVTVGREQVELLKEQVQKLTSLQQNSQNSNEQRDAVIHFMVQMMMQMEASQKEKKKTLSGVLIQISSLAAISADLSGIYEFVESELEELAKED